MSRKWFMRILLLLLAAFLVACLHGCASHSHEARSGFYPAINPRYRCEGTTMVKPGGGGAYCDGRLVLDYDGYDVSAADGKTAK